MPDKPQWLMQLPGAIKKLRALSDEDVDAATLAGFLGLKERNSQLLLERLGGQKVNGRWSLLRTELIRQLIRHAGPDYQEEKERQTKFWGNVTAFRAERIQSPPVHRDITREQMREALEKACDALPPGTFEPHRITVTFDTPDEMYRRFTTIVQAATYDFERFILRVLPDWPPAPPPKPKTLEEMKPELARLLVQATPSEVDNLQRSAEAEGLGGASRSGLEALSD